MFWNPVISETQSDIEGFDLGPLRLQTPPKVEGADGLICHKKKAREPQAQLNLRLRT